MVGFKLFSLSLFPILILVTACTACTYMILLYTHEWQVLTGFLSICELEQALFVPHRNNSNLNTTTGVQ